MSDEMVKDMVEGLLEYTERDFYKEALGIPKEVEVRYEPLAQGEYNMNYTFCHPVTGKRLVLRVNTGSQMHLDNQIGYEYHALKLLESSGRTPRPVYVDGSRKYLDYGVMVMEFLEGRPLDYWTDLKYAAECLADIHSVPFEAGDVIKDEKEDSIKTVCGLHCPSNPLQAVLDECKEMAETYYHSELGGLSKKRQIERMLRLGERKAEAVKDYDGYCCIINTELNSGNFLINGEGRHNFLVDWEKPLYGDPAQDLGHFLAPTTTFWKTDVILTKEAVQSFMAEYENAVGNRFDLSGLRERLDLFVPITCLRGITWCSMAWIQYQQPGRLIRNEDTFKKMEEYLSEEFLKKIEALL